MNWWVIFLTGLTTGGLSCLAMQGGLLASVIANQKEEELDELEKASSKRQRREVLEKYGLGKFDAMDWMPVGMFLLGKLVVHTVFGFLLGMLGSTITLSLNVRLAFQVFTGLFMFATAMNLLDVHPIFRYVVFQPPKFVQKWVRRSAKSKALFAPLVLGLMTIFIPCGVTQAMEVLAINSASPIQGAIIMFAFVLGTVPLFAILGVATAKLSEGLKDNFMKFAAYALIGMALYSFNGVMVVLDSPFTWQKFYDEFFGPPAYLMVDQTNVIQDGNVQRVNLEVLSHGYSPSQFTVNSGVPVELTLNSNGTYSCALAFTFREFGIFEMLEPTDSRIVTFTPTKPGRYMFACSMGMYVGYMDVI